MTLLLAHKAGDDPAMSRVRNPAGKPALHRLRVNGGGVGKVRNVLAGLRHSRSQPLVSHFVESSSEGSSESRAWNVLNVTRTCLNVLVRSSKVPGAGLEWGQSGMGPDG